MNYYLMCSIYTVLIGLYLAIINFDWSLGKKKQKQSMVANMHFKLRVLELIDIHLQVLLNSDWLTQYNA